MPIHQRHLQYLALEFFKYLMHLNPEFMWSYLTENPIPCYLRKETKAFLPPVRSFRLGLNSVHFRGSILWNNLPSSIKNSQTIKRIQRKIKEFGKYSLYFTVHLVCVVETFFIYILTFLKFLTFFFVMYISQVFIYCKVLII